MTKDKIAQWRELMRRTEQQGGVQVIVPTHRLECLFKEREVLLDALQRCVREAPSNANMTEPLNQARAAIAEVERE